MYLVSLHGHFTSASPSAERVADGVERPGRTSAFSSVIRSSTWVPMRAITRIEAVT